MVNEYESQEFFASSSQYHPTNTDLVKVPTTDYYKLERLATQYKKDGDWAGALACLYEVKNNLEDFDDPHYFTVALRFVLYLQAAGKFEEAKFELQSLVDELDYIVELKIGHHSDDKDYDVYFASTQNTLLSEIFDTARKIYKRENLIEEANDFENKAIQFRIENQANSEYLREQRSIRIREWQEERERDRQEYERWEQKQAELKQQEKVKKRSNFWLYVGLGLVAYIIIKRFWG